MRKHWLKFKNMRGEGGGGKYGEEYLCHSFMNLNMNKMSGVTENKCKFSIRILYNNIT